MTGQWSFTMPLEIWVFQLAYSGRITSHTQEIQLSYPLSSFYSFLTVKRWGDSHGQEKEILSDLNPRLKKKLITELKSSSQRIPLLEKILIGPWKISEILQISWLQEGQAVQKPYREFYHFFLASQEETFLPQISGPTGLL